MSQLRSPGRNPPSQSQPGFQVQFFYNLDSRLIWEWTKRAMTEGFAYAGCYVLERSRIALHRMVKALDQACGTQACVAVRTDCVYVKLAAGEAAKEALRKAGFTFEGSTESLWSQQVGVLRCEVKSGVFLPRSPLTLDDTERPTIPVNEAPVC